MWMEWTKRLQAIAQNGITYSTGIFDIERYNQIQDVVAEIISNHTDHDFAKVKDYLTNEAGYSTPKVDVRGVVFENNKILLVKEKEDNRWTIPGGWADILKTPSENVECEVFEESGYKVKATRLMAVYDRDKHGHKPKHPYSIYKMFFLCKIIGGEANTNIETTDVGFFDINELPELSVARITKKQIRRLFELKDNPLTDFD